MIKELEKIVGKENILTEPDSLEPYSHDETSGFRVFPKAVVKPKTTQETSEIMKFANKELIPVTPRGGGSCLSGGAVPSPGSIVISFERMNQIREIDTENLMAIAEPGVIIAQLADEAKKYGLFYPPYPASLDTSTVGGNIAECAGGARAVKYGTTKNYVLGVEAVLPTGEIIKCGGKLVKNVTGYNLTDLLVGSEGTLAIITLAILKLLPMPKVKVDLLIPFEDIEKAGKFAQEILQHKMSPSTIEIMEREAIEASERYLKRKLKFSVGNKYACSLLIEIDGERKEEIEHEYNEIGDIALKNGALDVLVALTEREQERLWEVRNSISDALKSESEVEREDIVVPRSKMPEFLHEIKRVECKYGLKIVSYGHIGDGNVHINILREDTPEQEWKAKIPNIMKELFEVGLSLGGMISGEHGIGLSKKPYLEMALGKQQIELMRGIKRVFDPNNILNPEKIFPDNK